MPTVKWVHEVSLIGLKLEDPQAEVIRIFTHLTFAWRVLYNVMDGRSGIERVPCQPQMVNNRGGNAK